MEKTLDLAKPAESTIYYPESDGQPMGETDFHIAVILYLRQALRHFFRRADQVYVAANMFFYYEEGDPSACKAPDVFVVKGISKHDRRIYQLWVETVVPCTIIEITSRATRLEDMAAKRGLYEFLEVKEYILFDPLNEYLLPRLQGFRLVGNSYQPMTLTPDGTLLSQELGAILKPEGALLRVVDPATGEAMPTLDEAVDQIQIALEQAQAEMERAATEAQRAEAEAQRAEAEAQRAEAAEAEAARLKAELEQLRRQMAKDE
jgi:Uma2 family endonuclease